MARVSAKEQAMTPIYFETRRKSKYSTPYVALPPTLFEELAERRKTIEAIKIPVSYFCLKCGREQGCNADCEDMNCEHCYCNREGRDG